MPRKTRRRALFNELPLRSKGVNVPAAFVTANSLQWTLRPTYRQIDHLVCQLFNAWHALLHSGTTSSRS